MLGHWFYAAHGSISRAMQSEIKVYSITRQRLQTQSMLHSSDFMRTTRFRRATTQAYRAKSTYLCAVLFGVISEPSELFCTACERERNSADVEAVYSRLRAATKQLMSFVESSRGERSKLVVARLREDGREISLLQPALGGLTRERYQN